MSNAIISQENRSIRGQYQYVSTNKNSDDVIPQMLEQRIKELTESSEYQEILKYSKDELCKLLINKRSNDLLTECTNCSATNKNIYNECKSIKRIIVILSVYNKLMNDDKLWRQIPLSPILTFKNIYTLTQINDDFIHIKDHMNEDDKFENEIRSNLREKFLCKNTMKCHGYRRWRYESKENTELHSQHLTNEDIVFQKECDKIHSYLIHSDDITTEPYEYVGKKEDDKWCDYKIDDMDNDKMNESIYCQLVQNMGIFRWQCPHGFNNKQYEGLMHLKPTYENIKQEILQNPYYRLSTDHWNQTLRKSVVFFKSFARRGIKTRHDGQYDDAITQQINKWTKGEVISLEEIVSLKLYTDFDKLQYELKKCFRFDTIFDIFTLKNVDTNIKRKHESDVDTTRSRYKLESRLQTFFWWRIRLLTVLNKYGEALNKNIALYHGVNGKMIINNGKTHGFGFYGPLSTSSSYHVARTFATAKGMVLQLSSQYPRLGICRGFNASLISDYPEEKEWLIGFAYLRIRTVLTRPLNKNWKTYNDIDDEINDYSIPLSSQTRSIFFAIHLFRQQIFSMSVHLEYCLSAFLYLCCKYDDNAHIKRTRFVATLKKIMKEKDNKKKDRYDTIINILLDKFDNFRRYPNKKQVVKIDEISHNLKPYFMDYHGKDIHKNEKYVISFSKIIKIFENVKEIHFINTYLFDNIALKKLIEFVDKNQKNKIKKIKFLYYDYKHNLYPHDSNIFCHPQKLNDNLLKKLKQKKWQLNYKNIGKTGYQIQICCKRAKPLIFVPKHAKKNGNRARLNIYISKELTSSLLNNICEIFKDAEGLYYYLDYSTALQVNDEYAKLFAIQCGKVVILNYDLHDKNTGNSLYGVCTPKNNHEGYKQDTYEWEMNPLLDQYEILGKYGISSNDLPRSSRTKPKFNNERKLSNQQIKIQESDIDSINVKNLAQYRPSEKEGKKKIKKLDITSDDFKILLKEALKKQNALIPTVKVNNKRHWIEWVLIVEWIQNGVTFGVSFKHDKNLKLIAKSICFARKDIENKCLLTGLTSKDSNHFIKSLESFASEITGLKFDEKKTN